MKDDSDECGFFKEEQKEEKLENHSLEEQNITLPLENNLKCKYCSSIPIDKEFFYTFDILVCKNCKFKNVQLITKSTCSKEYLLTQEEINLFKYITRPNPHKGNWSDMHLFLKNEIEEFSFKKYGSKEEIEKIKHKRKNDLLERKKRKIKKKIKELNKKTFVEKKLEPKHKHNFILKNKKSKCECGMEIEEEEI